jgi:hypothetical protein
MSVWGNSRDVPTGGLLLKAMEQPLPEMMTIGAKILKKVYK